MSLDFWIGVLVGWLIVTPVSLVIWAIVTVGKRADSRKSGPVRDYTLTDEELRRIFERYDG